MQSDIDKVLLLVEAALEAGIQPKALRDAIPRAMQVFQDATVDPTDARHWVASERHARPQYLGQGTGTASGGVVPTPPLTPAQVKALEGLSPTQKLTRYRELQQRQSRSTAEGGV